MAKNFRQDSPVVHSGAQPRLISHRPLPLSARRAGSDSIDGTCIERARASGTLCLRNYGNRCIGRHDGGGTEFSAYGRVCAVERDRQLVATTLPLRPYDEREGGPTTSLDSEPEVETKAALRARTNQPSDAETKQKLDNLRRRLDYVRDDILGCTERMELEKQIYDLEHPIGGDWNHWSEWEDEYDAWKEDVRRAIKGTRNPEGEGGAH